VTRAAPAGHSSRSDRQLPGRPGGRLRPLVALVLLLAGSARALADPQFIEMPQLRVVYYDPSETYLVQHTTQSMLSALSSYKQLFDYEPDGRVNVWLRDFFDRVNAHAFSEPRNRIFFDIAASNEPYETLNFGDRIESMAAHELTHIVTMDRASPEDQRFRHFFHGKVALDGSHPETLLYYYLTVPRSTAPRWYHEGSAVFMETWLSGGKGRAQGGYDEMVFRAMVQDKAKFYDPLGLVSKGTEVDFQTGANAYLYGTRFMDYLALTYGPDRLLSWWRRDAGTRRYYADDFRRVYGLPLNQSWQQWIDFEHAFQERNLVSVREQPITPHQDLTTKDLGSVSRNYLAKDGTRLYAAIQYPGQLAHLAAISTRDGSVTELHEIKGASGYIVTSLAYDPSTETLFYTTNNKNFRNLEAYDVRSGKSRTLMHGARIGDLAYNPADRSLWGLRLENGFVDLVRLKPPYQHWNRLYSFPAFQKAFDLALSADGSLAAVSVSGPSVKHATQQVTQVRIYRAESLASGDGTPLHSFEMGDAVPEGFVFSGDSRYVYGSSYYTGVSNIFRYELETETLAAVSNAETGFFRPLPLDDTNLIVLRYSATGFVPTRIEAHPTEDLSAITFLGQQVAEKYPEVQHWVAATPGSMPYESAIQRRGLYQRFREQSLESLIPIVQGYKDSVALGASARFSDPIGFDWILLDATYSPDNALPSKQRLHVSGEAHHKDWAFGAAWNGADFYDLFGPTKRSRAGYSGWIGYDYAFVYEPPKATDFVAKVAYYGGLDALPGFQNVPSPTQNLFTAEFGFVANDTERSPGAVDDEKGFRWSLKTHGYGAIGEFIPSVTGTFDFGVPLPIGHSSLWLRSGVAASAGSRTNPLANFYLGGFGNNYVDSAAHGGAQRYRDLLSMPGFGLDALPGKSLAKTTLEWSLPPIRFEALGSPGFFVSWARPELFAGALETDPTSSAFRRTAHDFGAQLDFQLHVMHREPMMLSIGVAKGTASNGLGDREFMLSLQIL
jgi:hypothetical protein